MIYYGKGKACDKKTNIYCDDWKLAFSPIHVHGNEYNITQDILTLSLFLALYINMIIYAVKVKRKVNRYDESV